MTEHKIPALAVELDRDALHAILDREDAASTELGRICAGGRFKMTIPTDIANDSDILIAAALADITPLVSTIRALTAQVVELTTSVRLNYGLYKSATEDLDAVEAQVVELTTERDSWAFQCGEANADEDAAMRRAEQAEAQVVERDAVIEQAETALLAVNEARNEAWRSHRDIIVARMLSAALDDYKVANKAPRDALAARDAVRDKTVRATALRAAAEWLDENADRGHVPGNPFDENDRGQNIPAWLYASAAQEETNA